MNSAAAYLTLHRRLLFDIPVIVIIVIITVNQEILACRKKFSKFSIGTKLNKVI